MSDFISGIVNWPFLAEPLYRWAIFMIAIGFIGAGWSGVLEFMK